MSDFKTKMHEIWFQTPLGNLQGFPGCLAGFKGPTSKERQGREMEGERNGEDGNGRGEKERGSERRESLFATNKEQRYKNILNMTTVAGYQKGIPIKLVAYSTNNIRPVHNATIQQKHLNMCANGCASYNWYAWVNQGRSCCIIW